jgi:hypothetical protein
MINKTKSSILLYLCYFITGVMLLPAVASCSKEGTNPGTTNAYLNIVNVSPDIRPFNLYANAIRQGLTTYSYPAASNYFLQNIADVPLELRPVLASNVTQTRLLILEDELKRNVRYTWFITGFRSDSSLATVFTVDSSAAPSTGRGKIRFVNVSINSPTLNLTANDTIAFSNVTYKKVTDYIELTAGNYNLNITATATPSTSIKTLPAISVLDGKLYTIYAYGLVGRVATDTAAFKARVILNTIPDKNL